MASAARYSPAGHPSVRSISSSARSSAGSRPAPTSSDWASGRLIASSSTPISRMPPRERRSDTGTGTSCSRADRHLRTGREAERQLGDDVATPTVDESLGIVEDDGHRGLHRRDRRDQRRDAGHAGTRRGQRSEHLRLDPFDAIEDHGEVGQEHGGVVVAGINRKPHHPRLLAFSPLGQQGRLAVARRSDDGDNRGLVGGDEMIDEGRPGDDPLAGRGRVELGFVQAERQPRLCPAILPRSGGRMRRTLVSRARR